MNEVYREKGDHCRSFVRMQNASGACGDSRGSESPVQISLPASFLRTGLLVLSVSCALQRTFNLAMLRLLKPARLEDCEAVLCWWVACIGSMLLLQHNEI